MGKKKKEIVIDDEKQQIKEISGLIDKLTYRRNRWEVLTDFFEISAITVSNRFDHTKADEREKRYQQIIKSYNEEEMQLVTEAFARTFMLLTDMPRTGKFDDYLGKLYMESATSNKSVGQFFTPYNLSQACARLTIDAERLKEDKIYTMLEPTCGSGGMILAAVEDMHNKGFNYSYNLFVECGDIDSRCVHMTYLQLGLAGVPAAIYHRNGLTLETWDVWHTPALCMNWLRFRKYVM